MWTNKCYKCEDVECSRILIVEGTLEVYLSTRQMACFIILVYSVCMFTCLSVCQTITFERHQVESSYLHIQYVSRGHHKSWFSHLLHHLARNWRGTPRASGVSFQGLHHWLMTMTMTYDNNNNNCTVKCQRSP